MIELEPNQLGEFMRIARRPTFISAALALLVCSLEAQEPKEPDSVKRARTKLASDAEDPDANLTVGKYLAFDRNDWENGLPLLGKGSDALLKPVVEKDLANPKDPKDQVKVGDGWTEWGAKRAAFRPPALLRAMYWYQTAWPFLEGADKDSLRKVFYKAAAPPPDYEKLPKKRDGFPAGWEFGGSMNSFPDLAFARTGRGSGKILPAPNLPTRQASMISMQYPIIPGKKYKASGWIYTDQTDADGAFDIGFWDVKGTLFGFDGGVRILMDTPCWRKLEKEGVAPDGAIRIQVRIWSQHNKGAVWVDDVSLAVEGKEILKNGGFEDK